MIPVLWETNVNYFTGQTPTGRIAWLGDAASCVVTEERNGQYELEMEYPVTGTNYAEIREERIITAEPSEGMDPQPFRIYAISRPLEGVVTVHACHISYDLKRMVVMPFRAGSAPAAMQEIQTNLIQPGSGTRGKFTFWTDKTTAATMDQTVPIECRSLLGGVQGSVLDVYGGGEYEFDGFDVKLHQNRGADNGVTISYGKNLTGLQADTDYSGVYTSMVPYVVKEDGVVVGDKIESAYVGNYSEQKCVTHDFSEQFETLPTKEDLNAAAESYMQRNEPWVPKMNLDVEFAPLWQTEEYAKIAPLERVRLCDTVKIEHEALGISATAKVIRTEYDVLAGRYRFIGLGDARTSLAETVSESFVRQEDKNTQSWFEQAIQRATNLLRGGLGGHVLIKTNANGEPEEILIMDKPTVEEAVKIWRWNMGGLGYSENGYNGPFRTAITQDGEIVADFITAGTLDVGKVLLRGIIASENNAGFIDFVSGDIYVQYVYPDGLTHRVRLRGQNSAALLLEANGQEVGSVYIGGTDASCACLRNYCIGAFDDPKKQYFMYFDRLGEPTMDLSNIWVKVDNKGAAKLQWKNLYSSDGSFDEMVLCMAD